jgi:hypothetical protein
MRPAPPLALSVEHSRAWRGLCALLAACAAAALAAWAVAHLDGPGAAQAWAAAGSGLVGGALGRLLAGPARPANLQWDGLVWRVDGTPGLLEVMLDGGRWLMLLRLRPAAGGRVRWLALAFAPGAGGQRALRTALYSPPPTSIAEPPPVRPPERAPD